MGGRSDRKLRVEAPRAEHQADSSSQRWRYTASNQGRGSSRYELWHLRVATTCTGSSDVARSSMPKGAESCSVGLPRLKKRNAVLRRARPRSAKDTSTLTPGSRQGADGAILDRSRAVIREDTSLVFAKVKAAIDGFGGTFVEAHQLDVKTAKKIPKKMIGRMLTSREAAELLVRIG